MLILRLDTRPKITMKTTKLTSRGVVVVKKQLTQNEQTFIQMHFDRDWSLDVVKGTYPDNISLLPS